MSRWIVATGASLIALALTWAAVLAWRLTEGAVGPSDGETAAVVVAFNWVLALGVAGLVLTSMGLLARMRRKHRPRM